MRPVLPRSLRPRLLLLPLVLGVLIAPAFLTTSAVPAMEHDAAAGTVCSNVRSPIYTVPVPRAAPHCVNCRAPLLNAPLARVDRAAPAVVVALPPAA